MSKEFLGKQTVASLIRLIKMELAKYAKTTALDTVNNNIQTLFYNDSIQSDNINALQARPISHDIRVMKPTKAGSIKMEENTYYQFLGGTEKKKIRFYNSDGSLAYSPEFQMLTVYCGTLDDTEMIGDEYQYGVRTAYLTYTGNTTNFAEILTNSKAVETNCFAFKKLGYEQCSAYVDYPANSIIIMQKRNT